MFNISKAQSDSVIWTRNFSEKNLNLLSNKLSSVDFTGMDSHNNINDKWFFIKDKILSELDKISPLKKTIIKPDNKCPWFDLELTKSKSARDSLYEQSVKSKLDIVLPKLRFALAFLIMPWQTLLY